MTSALTDDQLLTVVPFTVAGLPVMMARGTTLENHAAALVHTTKKAIDSQFSRRKCRTRSRRAITVNTSEEGAWLSSLGASPIAADYTSDLPRSWCLLGAACGRSNDIRHITHIWHVNCLWNTLHLDRASTGHASGRCARGLLELIRARDLPSCADRFLERRPRVDSGAPSLGRRPRVGDRFPDRNETCRRPDQYARIQST